MHVIEFVTDICVKFLVISTDISKTQYSNARLSVLVLPIHIPTPQCPIISIFVIHIPLYHQIPYLTHYIIFQYAIKDLYSTLCNIEITVYTLLCIIGYLCLPAERDHVKYNWNKIVIKTFPDKQEYFQGSFIL